MRYYPVFLDLKHKTCLVVGAGRVGIRKIRTLVQCSPSRIIVLDRHVTSLNTTDPEKIIKHLKDDFSPHHLEGCDLAFACTSDPGTNQQVIKACRERKIWVNAAERPEQGDFILPGVFSRQDLIVAVSTCGCSPALTSRIKQDLQEIFGPEYALLTGLLAGVRKMLLPLNFPQEVNREYFNKIVDSEALALLESGRRQELSALLHEILPPDLHNQIQDLIDALI